MNNKQLACFVLSVVLGLMAYATLSMKKKATAAIDETKQASDKATTAENDRKAAQISLDKMDRGTVALRDYLDQWAPYLQQTKDEGAAERLLNSKLKQGALVIFRQSLEPVKLSTTSTIPNALRARISFERRKT